jgi:hypothetical protein
MKFVIAAAATAAMLSFAPAPSMAQGVEVGVPGVGVRIGEPGYHRDHWRDRDVRVEHRGWRDRDVRLGGSCKTVTITRDDGSVKQIRRCN